MLCLFVHHSPQGYFKIKVVYPAEMHGESVCRLATFPLPNQQAQLENIYYSAHF